MDTDSITSTRYFSSPCFQAAQEYLHGQCFYVDVNLEAANRSRVGQLSVNGPLTLLCSRTAGKNTLASCPTVDLGNKHEKFYLLQYLATYTLIRFIMPLVVQPVQKVDVEAAAAVHHAAFGSTSSVHSIMYPNGNTPTARADMKKTYRDNFRDPNNTCLKVVDTDHDNRLVAWIDFKTTKTEQKENPFDRKPEPESEAKSNPDLNTEFVKAFFGGIGDLKRRHIGTRANVHVGLLVADPAYHRRGSGKMLLHECAKHADALQLPTVLEASPLAAPLYIREGFVPVEGAVAELDLKPWGHDELHRTVMMERPPKQ